MQNYYKVIANKIAFFTPQSISEQQRNNIIMITFWSQFASYSLNIVLILFLTRPLTNYGLGYSQAKAYAFIGISQATGYLLPILGGFIADQILGIRRAILVGSILMATTYLLIVFSGLTLVFAADKIFLVVFAFLPAAASLLTGTASSMIVQIYAKDSTQANAAMTFYYMAINVGALLATIVSPFLLENIYGPLSILGLAFIGKTIAARNFIKKYSIYNSVVWGKDKSNLNIKQILQIISYIIVAYCLTLLAYFYIYLATIIVSSGCIGGILWFFYRTLKLKNIAKSKQLIALGLILEAIIFFIIYNQMSTTLILCAKNNSDLILLGMKLSPAQYQLLNPLLILVLGSYLPKIYKNFPKFSLPYQFAAGNIVASLALLIMAFATTQTTTGYINGNYIGLTYIFITLAELLISAGGLCMIGLYCDKTMIAFAMGVWYIASSLSNTISGQLAKFAAFPQHDTIVTKSLLIYQNYYLLLGIATLLTSCFMFLIAFFMQKKLSTLTL